MQAHEVREKHLYWHVAVMARLVVGATQNCWSLLLDLAGAKRHLAIRRSAAGEGARPEA